MLQVGCAKLQNLTSSASTWCQVGMRRRSVPRRQRREHIASRGGQRAGARSTGRGRQTRSPAESAWPGRGQPPRVPACGRGAAALQSRTRQPGRAARFKPNQAAHNVRRRGMHVITSRLDKHPSCERGSEGMAPARPRTRRGQGRGLGWGAGGPNACAARPSGTRAGTCALHESGGGGRGKGEPAEHGGRGRGGPLRAQRPSPQQPTPMPDQVTARRACTSAVTHALPSRRPCA